jgi:hypothetical protein
LETLATRNGVESRIEEFGNKLEAFRQTVGQYGIKQRYQDPIDAAATKMDFALVTAELVKLLAEATELGGEGYRLKYDWYFGLTRLMKLHDGTLESLELPVEIVNMLRLSGFRTVDDICSSAPAIIASRSRILNQDLQVIAEALSGHGAVWPQFMNSRNRP